MSLFRCENITKYYREIPTITDISIRLEAKETVTLVGASGVGKTTLFNILAGVDTADSGSIFLGEKNVTSVAGKVGYMLQKDLLLAHKTLMDNIVLPLILKGVTKPQAYIEAEKYLPIFGLEGYGKYYPKELSGGMKQRGALLRTFFMGSKVLLLDEPFSAIDPINKFQLWNWFRETVKRLEISTLLITHDVEEAILLSHRIYVMAGTPGNITKEFVIPAFEDKDAVYTRDFQRLKQEIVSLMTIK